MRAKFNDWKSKSDVGMYSGGGAVALTSAPSRGAPPGAAVGRAKADAARVSAESKAGNMMKEENRQRMIPGLEKEQNPSCVR